MANVYTRECKFGRTTHLNEFVDFSNSSKNAFNEKLVRQEKAKKIEDDDMYERPWSLKRKADLNVDYLHTLACHEMPNPCYSYETVSRRSYQIHSQEDRILTHLKEREAAIGAIPGVSPVQYCTVKFLTPPSIETPEKYEDEEPMPCEYLAPCECCYPKRGGCPIAEK